MAFVVYVLDCVGCCWQVKKKYNDPMIVRERILTEQVQKQTK